MSAAISSVSQTHFQQLRACLGICRSCLETARLNAAYRNGLTDLVLALEVAVAMIEIGYRHAIDHLRYCAEKFTSVAKAWHEGGSCRCRACIKLCEDAVKDWRS